MGLSPRAYHSVTLLTDGRVLVAGGISRDGELLATAETWDARTNTGTLLPGQLTTARRGHTAGLLPDGRVLLWGGWGVGGEVLKNGELFDPETQSFVPTEVVLPEEATATQGPGLVGSLPEDRSQSVPVSTIVGQRFSVPLRVQGVGSGTVVLTGRDKAVRTKVVPAEGGMLAFVTPTQQLEPGTDYTVSLTDLTDQSGRPVPPARVTFATSTAADDGEQWIPASGDWTTGRPASPWSNLPSLQAPAGVTALAGQILKLNGDPLPSVTLVILGQRAHTDQTGRFLLRGLPAGRNVLLIDGRTADRPGKTYGLFEYGTDLTAGVTNVLPFTIWMPVLDTARAVSIPSPTVAETTVTTPLLPGLEFQIPANTIIYDNRRNPVHQIGITPIPLDRPPFPLPTGVNVPIYFTIQPGGGYIKVLGSGGPTGARLIYPNTGNAPPRTRFSFWDYDADQKGWFVYGHGSVAKTWKQIIPDPGVVIYELTGAMVAGSGLGAPTGGPPGGNAGGDPVDLSTGLFVYTKTDLVLPDTLPLVLTRRYRPGDPTSRAFGIGTNFNYDIFVVGDASPWTYQDLVLPDGGRVHYQRTSSGTSWGDAVYEHTSSPTEYFGSVIKWNGNGWNLTFKNGTVYQFPISDVATRGERAACTNITDRYGNQLTFTRDSNSNLTQITSPSGKFIQLTYDSSNRATQAQDNIGRVIKYAYDASGRLSSVTDANGGVTSFTYDSANEMLTITDPRQIVYLTNQYDADGRVIQQTQADNSTYKFAYTTDSNGHVTQTDVTDPRGNIHRVAFYAPGIFPNGYLTGGYSSSEIFALGKPEQQTFTYNRGQTGFVGPGITSNLLQSTVDSLVPSRTTTDTCDAMGNVLSTTRLAGTSNAVTTSFTYDPTFNQLTSVTDPLNHKTTLTIDSQGNLTAAADPLGNTWTFAYDSTGRPVSAADPLKNTTLFNYDSTGLIAVTDPLGNTVNRFPDWGGRLVGLADPLGNNTLYSYDNLNQLTQVSDAQGNASKFSYDPNGNLLSVTDARNNVTSYSYDSMDRPTSRKDPLLRSEGYQYDSNGNITQFTDRRGTVTTFQYDALDRRIFAGFGTQPGPTYQSTVNYTFDAGNRLTQAVDSISGTITRVYDGLDRLKSDATPQGTVTYGYDAAGRRTSFQVTGQTALMYGYDTADRLTGITQGSSTVGFAYDAASRRTT